MGAMTLITWLKLLASAALPKSACSSQQFKTFVVLSECNHQTS
jgi:hypothetical protein